MACVALETAQVYIVDVDSGRAYRLAMKHSVQAVVFDPSGQRLITVHLTSVCIIDSMSSLKLHETSFFDCRFKIEALSWPEHGNTDDSDD